MGSETIHEPIELLSEHTRNLHRSIVSLMEELEAIDWYQQRAEACTDEELKRILLHNRDEEVEHACMALEWIRRHDEVFDAQLRTYLFRDAPIAAVEAAATSAEGPGAEAVSRGPTASSEAGLSRSGPSESLGIGSLKGKS